mgnify:CR=1 FL=1
MEAQQYQNRKPQADGNGKDKQTDEPSSSPQLPFMSQHPFHGPCINRSERLRRRGND